MDCIIFGAGNIGRLLVKFCKFQKNKVIKVYDNDSCKWGKRLSGIKICNPNEIKNQKLERKYMIASELHWKAMKEQLVSYGIEEKDISVYSDYNSLYCQYNKIKGYKEVSETKYLYLDKPQYINSHFIWIAVKTFFQRIIYKIVLSIHRPQMNDEKKYNVAICAIFKDESDYLREWIEFHLLIGIEHFYLYNNFSEDDYDLVLNEYIQQEIVTLIDWPIKKGQMTAYQHCVDNYAFECKWIGFFDIDEFCVPNHFEKIYEFLRTFNRMAPIVLINWRYFGSSGMIDRDIKSHPVVEDFVVSWSKYSDIGKFFYNTAYEYNPSKKHGEYMHYMWGKLGKLDLPPVNVFGQICLNGFFPMKSDDLPVQLNHYVTKSYFEYMRKKVKRGDAVFDINPHNEQYFFDHDSKCQSTDYHIYKYLVALKKKCGYSD